jgi:hypothetical protein
MSQVQILLRAVMPRFGQWRRSKFMGERSADQKALADAAQPLYASLDDQQKRRFAKQLFGIGRWPDRD